MTNNERQFVIELEALTRKYGIAVGGCGCCGSPWLDTAPDLSAVAGYRMTEHSGLKWTAPKDDYDWKFYSKDIVR